MKKQNYEAPVMEQIEVRIEENFLDSFGGNSSNSKGPANIADENYHNNVGW